MKQIKNIEIGQLYADDIGIVKVICFVEKNYVVAKRKRCMPFILTLNKFSKSFMKATKITDL